MWQPYLGLSLPSQPQASGGMQNGHAGTGIGSTTRTRSNVGHRQGGKIFHSDFCQGLGSQALFSPTGYPPPWLPRPTPACGHPRATSKSCTSCLGLTLMTMSYCMSYRLSTSSYVSRNVALLRGPTMTWMENSSIVLPEALDVPPGPKSDRHMVSDVRVLVT